MRIGLLTGGGDCPGLNAVIRAVGRRSFSHGHEVLGIRAGWKGLVDGLIQPLGPREIGEALAGPFAGRWKYRVGDYRIIASIDDSAVTIIVIRIGNRREVYR